MKIIEFWPLIVVFICGVATALLFAVKFSKEPTEKKVQMVMEWMLYAVIQAEKEMGAGTGQIKLRYVWDMFIKTFPDLAQVVSFDGFSKLVDQSLITMRHILDTNCDVLNYVESK